MHVHVLVTALSLLVARATYLLNAQAQAGGARSFHSTLKATSSWNHGESVSAVEISGHKRRRMLTSV